MPLYMVHGSWAIRRGPTATASFMGQEHLTITLGEPRFRTYAYRTAIIQVSMTTFVQDLENHVLDKLSRLDLLKEPEIGPVDRSEIVRRLKIALKNELEASEIAAVWIPTTPEIDVKLSLARQVGDEAKHYKLIEDHLKKLGVDL